jgi:murein DD-endopeptidase MepM/ murein hydrolase activator NlpD
MKAKALIVSIFLSSCSFNQVSLNSDCSYPKHAPYPGGIINTEISKEKFNSVDELRINNLTPIVCSEGTSTVHLIFPIALETKRNNVEISSNDIILEIIALEQKAYRESRITIKDNNLVNPSKEYLPRIRQEAALLKAARNTLNTNNRLSMEMELPVIGVESSEFGVRRFINKSPRNRHTGTDIAAKEGTNVYSPLGGMVILNGRFFYRGNIVFIDHGNGLISSFSHLESSLVLDGQIIEKGQLIGTVGKTGRVTGPHLHWEVTVLSTPVDPKIFLSTVD